MATPDSIRFYDSDGHICLLISQPGTRYVETPRHSVYRVNCYAKETDDERRGRISAQIMRAGYRPNGSGGWWHPGHMVTV